MTFMKILYYLFYIRLTVCVLEWFPIKKKNNNKLFDFVHFPYKFKIIKPKINTGNPKIIKKIIIIRKVQTMTPCMVFIFTEMYRKKCDFS